MFLDADDIWKKNKLLLQINLMILKNYDISHASYEIRDYKNNLVGFRKARNFDNFKKLLPSCDIGLSTVVARKKFLIKILNSPELKTKKFVLWLKILKKY